MRTGFPWRSTWIIGSPPKVGKSKFVEGLWRTTGKPVLHLDLEGSTEDLTGYILPISGLTELRDTIRTLRTDPASGHYAAIALDTLDVLNSWAEEETCRELGIEYLGADLPGGKGKQAFGGDWAKSRGKVADVIEALQQTGKLILLLAHTKVEKGVFSGTTLALPTGLTVRVLGTAQVIAYMFCSEGANGRVLRYLTFNPADNTIAGSRYAELNEQVVPLNLVGTGRDAYVDWTPIFRLFGEGEHGKA